MMENVLPLCSEVEYNWYVLRIFYLAIGSKGLRMQLRRRLVLLAAILWLLASFYLLIVIFYFSAIPVVASTSHSQPQRSQKTARHASSSHPTISRRDKDALLAHFNHSPLSTSLDPTPYTGKTTPTATATATRTPTVTATATPAATTTTEGGQPSSGKSGTTGGETNIWNNQTVAAIIGAIVLLIGTLAMTIWQNSRTNANTARQKELYDQVIDLTTEVHRLDQEVKNLQGLNQDIQTAKANQTAIDQLQQTVQAHQAAIDQLQQPVAAKPRRQRPVRTTTPIAPGQRPGNGNQQSSPFPSPLTIVDDNGRTADEREEALLQKAFKNFAVEELDKIPITGFENVKDHGYITRFIAGKDRSQSASKDKTQSSSRADNLNPSRADNLNSIRDPLEIISERQRQYEWETNAHFLEYNQERLDLTAQFRFAHFEQSGSAATVHTSEKCRYIIEGAADSSKNLLLHYLGQKALRGDGVSWNGVAIELAIYIDLNQYSTGTSIFSILAHGLYEKLPDILSADEEKDMLDKSFSTFEKLVEKYIEKFGKEGKVLLLLADGDGETEGETREEKYKAIKEFLKTHSSLHILMTVPLTVSKNDDLIRSTFPLFGSLKALQLCPDDIRKIIQARFSDNEKASKINWWLEWHPRIQALASSPFILEKIIALLQVKFAHDRPSVKILALYKAYTDLPGNELKDGKTQTSKLLRWFAYYLHTRGLHKATKEEIKREWIKTESEKNGQRKGQNGQGKKNNRKEDIQINRENEFKKSMDILLTSGFLDEEEHYYRFACFSYQEFFTAEYIHQDATERVTFLKHYAEPWWEEVILLYIGLVDSEETVRAFLTQLGYAPGDGRKRNPEGGYREDSEFYTKLLIAGKAVALYGKYPVKDREDIEADLLNQLARVPYLLIQTKIVAVLREITGTKGVNVDEQKLALFISDDNRRTWLLKCLIDHHIPSIPFQFIPLLASSPSDMGDSTRENIASKIFYSPQLTDLLADSTPVNVRIGLVHALGMVDEYDDREKVYENLLGILTQTADPFFGWHLALIVGRLGDPEKQQLDILNAQLHNDKPLLLKWAIVCTLYEWSRRGHLLVATRLRELLLDPGISPLLIRWCILNALKTLLLEISDTFESDFRQPLKRFIKSNNLTSSLLSEAPQVLPTIEALLHKDQAKSVIDMHIREVTACIEGTGEEQEKRSCMEDLVWQLSMVGSLFAIVVSKPGEGSYVATKIQELEELLGKCQESEKQESRREISNQLYFTLQKMKRLRQVSDDDVTETSASLSKE